ncbi:MAG TPA: BON domain-containing protein, partial [Isosphaeraceae bacterium]|nr:BON domain-containing protein [Isosphaeraceae bacterium]
MRTKMTILAGLGAILTLGLAAATAQEPGVAQKLGQAIDNTARQVRNEAGDITDAVRRRYDLMAADVHRMGAIPRVYSRLHWDKALTHSRIEVHAMKGGAILLKGVVPDEAARKRAEELTASTVDVEQVFNELTV